MHLPFVFVQTTKQYYVVSDVTFGVFFKAKRKEQIRAAHDEAIFGAPVILPSIATDDEAEPETEIATEKKESNGSELAASLLSEKVNYLFFLLFIC